eukprot:2816675-Rhodomonas_salina.5
MLPGCARKSSCPSSAPSLSTLHAPGVYIKPRSLQCLDSQDSGRNVGGVCLTFGVKQASHTDVDGLDGSHLGDDGHDDEDVEDSHPPAEVFGALVRGTPAPGHQVPCQLTHVLRPMTQT